MKKNIYPFAFWGYSFICFALLTQCNSGTDIKDSYLTASPSPTSLCISDPSWFPHSQTPPPEEGEKSPFASSTSTNEMFHQWSWQKFLWLTKPDEGGRALFLNQQQVMQVDTAMQVVQIPSGTFVRLESTIQAGSMHPMLKTNPDYNGAGQSETVYYSIHVNDKMYQSSLEYASKISSSSGKYLNNEFTFPVGAFELKAAWVATEAIPESKRGEYYKTLAFVSSTQEKKEVALIGLHVIGVVQNHPEFIWATFQHKDLTPIYNPVSDTTTSEVNTLLFRKGKVKGIDGILFDTTTKLGKIPYQVFDLFEYGVPRNEDGSFMCTSQQGGVNYTNIKGINECVKSNLKDDVWSNYFYNGSIWLDMDNKNPNEQAKLIVELKNKIGSAYTNSYARGSLNCSNVTMESFTQTFQPSKNSIKVDNLANCFSCHKAQSFSREHSSPLYLSHTFQALLLKKLGQTPSQIDQLKTMDEETILQLMR